jgi:putative methionine-R-sulfoxide reductase with GAF domain
VPKEKEKTVFDEQTLAKLLEAAYVVQEHNRKLQAMGLRVKSQDRPNERAWPAPQSSIPAGASEKPAPAARGDYTLALAQIVETQHQIQVRRLELDDAIALVAERAASIAGAGGAAIGLLDSGRIRYKATFGLMTLPAGTELPAEKALCATCLSDGEIIHCEDVDLESFLNSGECERRGIQAMIAAPIYQVDGIAGGLELYYGSKHAFTEQDVHTCQLMAGLVTEALARGEGLAWKKSLADERSVMLEALEKLKPDLAALVGAFAAEDSSTKAAMPPTAQSTSTFLCRKCGHKLVGAEQFCGNCGSPRSDYQSPAPQTGVTLSPPQKDEQDNAPGAGADGAKVHTDRRPSFDENRPEKALAEALEQEMHELLAAPESGMPESGMEETPLMEEFTEPESPKPVVPGDAKDAAEPDLAAASEMSEESDGQDASPSRTMAKREPPSAWTSAAKAREFLEQVAAARPSGALSGFWNSRRGDVYLAIAVILVACVIRWGVWSTHAASATGRTATAAAAHRNPAPDADLSLFDRALIKLGLAEAPEPPQYKGNPETRVWVDLHTALYYCPGTDLYGKTPKGKFTTQRDAQLNQFEPAYQRACD